MSQEAPGPRPLSFRLARAAALVVSIGVVATVTVRAGMAGCRTSPDIGAENPSATAADEPAVFTGRGSAAATTAVPDDDDVRFMGGSKAPAGNWAFPSKPAAEPSAAQSASPQAPAQTASPQAAKSASPKTAPQTPAANAPAHN